MMLLLSTKTNEQVEKKKVWFVCLFVLAPVLARVRNYVCGSVHTNKQTKTNKHTLFSLPLSRVASTNTKQKQKRKNNVFFVVVVVEAFCRCSCSCCFVFVFVFGRTRDGRCSGFDDAVYANANKDEKDQDVVV